MCSIVVIVYVDRLRGLDGYSESKLAAEGGDIAQREELRNAMAEAGVAAAAATGGESARQEIGEHPREPSDTAAGSDSEERALLRHDSGIDPDEVLQSTHCIASD